MPRSRKFEKLRSVKMSDALWQTAQRTADIDTSSAAVIVRTALMEYFERRNMPVVTDNEAPPFLRSTV
jgi:predicted transcriptional regulator